jgi:hypothetical protein
MLAYSQPTPKVAVARWNLRHVAAILSSAILAIGDAGIVSADSLDSPSSQYTPPAPALDEHTMVRCQQIYGLHSRYNSDGYARPLRARVAMEECAKGKFASGVPMLKGALDRAKIPHPPMASATAAGTANSAAAEAPPDPRTRCQELTSYYDRYGVGRDEDSDGVRNHTRIGADIDCRRGQYDKGIAVMAVLLKSRKFDVPRLPAAVAQPAAPPRPHGEKQRQAQQQISASYAAGIGAVDLNLLYRDRRSNRKSRSRRMFAGLTQRTRCMFG